MDNICSGDAIPSIFLKFSIISEITFSIISEKPWKKQRDAERTEIAREKEKREMPVVYLSVESLQWIPYGLIRFI